MLTSIEEIKQMTLKKMNEYNKAHGSDGRYVSSGGGVTGGNINKTDSITIGSTVYYAGFEWKVVKINKSGVELLGLSDSAKGKTTKAQQKDLNVRAKPILITQEKKFGGRGTVAAKGKW
jgi:hypothetical protein